MNEQTAAAVKITVDNQLDYKRLLIDLVRHSPAHFEQLLEDAGDDLDVKLASIFLQLDPALYTQLAEQQVAAKLKLDTICGALRDNDSMTAIRTIRLSGFGLKEAMDIFKHARFYLYSGGRLGSSQIYAAPDDPLTTTQQAAVTAIVAHF